MELKTKYQYTYFLYPFMIKENRYSKYILKLLKNQSIKYKIFEKEKNIDIYNYFIPKIRNYMFSSFTFNKTKINKLNELALDTKAAIISKMPCAIFEYNLPKDIQGTTEQENGIFFKIQNIEIICFNTGVCFLSIKTNVENTEKFTDILNFNYKFRSINEETLNNYDNIRIQTDLFSDVKELKTFISEIAGSNQFERKNLDINQEKFFTYSYTCIDQSNWNVEEDFNNLKSIYTKYVKILPNDNNILFNTDQTKIMGNWNYAKLGLTKVGVTLFASNIEINNYTVFPHEFENQYLYTYILALYVKIYIKTINADLKHGINVTKARKKFIEFTKNIWIQEITEEDIGTQFYNNLKSVLELDDLYLETKNRYDILYKELNIEKNTKINKIIVIILLASLIINILNFIALI